jgi:SAM-dependent methyltransferase
LQELKEVYDQRYAGDYREQLAGFEIARWEALDHFITHVLAINDAKRVLDYGAGVGLHVGLWEKLFPESSLHFCDISSVAKEKFRLKHPSHADSYCLVHNCHADLDDSSFDVVVSVEVMEHVENLTGYLKDIHRLLKPGGRFVWTTPCANELSIEHIFSFLTGKIEETNEGYRRWRWEDPTHIRRVRSREITKVLKECGFDNILFRFRSHLFSFVCTYCPPRSKFKDLREKLMTLDYRLFRRLPNGASMLGSAVSVK